MHKWQGLIYYEAMWLCTQPVIKSSKIHFYFKNSSNLWTTSSNCFLISFLWVVAHPEHYLKQLFACTVFSLGPRSTHAHTHVLTHYTHPQLIITLLLRNDLAAILSGSSLLRCTRVVTDTAWLQEVALSYFLKNLWPQSQNDLSSRAHQHEKKTEQPPLSPGISTASRLLVTQVYSGIFGKKPCKSHAKPHMQSSEFNTARHMDTSFILF